MGTTINDDTMTSDKTSAAARLQPDARADNGAAWVVNWLPERLLARNQAITAMVLADEVAAWDGCRAATAWLFIQAHADELGLSGPDAVREISR